MKPDPYKKKASRRYNARKGTIKKPTEGSNLETTRDSNNPFCSSNKINIIKNSASQIGSPSNNTNVADANSLSNSDEENFLLNLIPGNIETSLNDPNPDSASPENKPLSNNSFFLDEADIEALEKEKAEEEERKKELENFSIRLKQKIENGEEGKNDTLSFFRTKKGRNGKFKGKKIEGVCGQPVQSARLASGNKIIEPSEKAYVKRLDAYKPSSVHSKPPLAILSNDDKNTLEKPEKLSIEASQENVFVDTYQTLKEEDASQKLTNSCSKQYDFSLASKNSILSQAEDFLDDLLNQDIAREQSPKTHIKQQEKQLFKSQPIQNLVKKVTSDMNYSKAQEADLEALLDDLLI